MSCLMWTVCAGSNAATPVRTPGMSLTLLLATRPVQRYATGPGTSRYRPGRAYCPQWTSVGLCVPVGVLEDLVEGYPEDAGDLEGHFEGGGVPALLDGDDGLPGDPDALG